MSTALLPVIQTQLVRFGTTVILFLGCFGNGYVVFLFIRHRKNACAMFLLSAAVMNIIYLVFSIPLTVYTYEYGDPSLYSMSLCKLRYYLFHVWGQMSRYFILLACIDRFALTHMNANMRALSQPHIARRWIVITTIFWHLFALHIVIMTTVKNGRCGYFDLYSTLNSIYVLIFVCLLPPVGMGIFGYLALLNMKRLHNRVQTTGTANASIVIHRQDRNLLVMVLAEVLIYVVTMSLYPAIILELAVTNPMATSKSLQQVQIENFILFIAQILIYINTSAPFYIYLTVSKTFRKDFKETFNIFIHTS
ncbi:unnamed protein product [Adineta steineri]|uniref:G-protein coupled receptors family 1 profile domain-containing protein n=1 Tax=Adineta steineri TaxID=433720 RepID=A0A815B3C7_9BILA|nr:unnamed protein product [Adineta steineri]CAF1552767.1 unnamed protein product [Adineta steineri]